MRASGNAGTRQRGNTARTDRKPADGSAAEIGHWQRGTAAWLVSQVEALLTNADVAEARREARDLVAALADKPRFWPSLEPTAPVTPAFVHAGRAAAQRRAAGAPFAYAVGRAAFRYLTLKVDERVLIPRQETELLVEIVLSTVRNRSSLSALDVGTGSGAIALALATEGRFADVTGTDVSLDALAVAAENAAMLSDVLRTPVTFHHGAEFGAVTGRTFDVIVANPPYIAFEELTELPASVRDWEPATALVCADHGLEVTRRVIRGAPRHLRHGGLLALEVDERRAQAVASLARAERLHDVLIHRDLAGRERFVTARGI